MTAIEALAREKRFDWPLCYEAENLIAGHLEFFTGRNRFAAHLANRMIAETGTLLLDWVDHLMLPKKDEQHLHAVGFVEELRAETPSHLQAFWHPEAMLPRVLIERDSQTSPPPRVLAIRCEGVADFMAAHGLAHEPDGAPLSRFRRGLVSEEEGTRLEAVERRGYLGYVPATGTGEAESLLKGAELWRTRPRQFASDAEGYRITHALVDRVVQRLGPDLACHTFFAEERAWWQRRNHAARVQKARQDKLGLGWANHDHHTFRSSREHFVDLMRVLEKLGFERRERYYAGAHGQAARQALRSLPQSREHQVQSPAGASPQTDRLPAEHLR